MMLPGAVLFPHALLPLHIFERRYRSMLADALDTRRVFVVTQLDPEAAAPGRNPSPRVASAGIIRACQRNADGTSDLLLQGFCRVEILDLLRLAPYPCITVRPLLPEAGGTLAELRALRAETVRLFDLKHRLGLPLPEDMLQLVQGIEDPDAYADLSAFALCEGTAFKQRLLETLATKQRLLAIARQLQIEIGLVRLQQRLQGGLVDDRISSN